MAEGASSGIPSVLRPVATTGSIFRST
ncbi:MAG: hypothetical protein RLZZ565_1452, partial [Planctomycetota bacterium]